MRDSRRRWACSSSLLISNSARCTQVSAYTTHKGPGKESQSVLNAAHNSDSSLNWQSQSRASQSSTRTTNNNNNNSSSSSNNNKQRKQQQQQ
jgi:hypothetical protein